MKRKILTGLSIIYIYIYTIAAIPNAWALSDATSFNPEQVQVHAQSTGVPVGTVIVWTKEAIPDGWLECDGQKVNEVLYPDLATLMPTTPNYKGRFLQGTDTSTKVGDRLEAGLPNITGSFYGTAKNGNYMLNRHIGIGAFENAYNIKQFESYAQTNRAPISWSSPVVFNAARSNSIYGNSSTVQPPAVLVKYIIKAE